MTSFLDKNCVRFLSMRDVLQLGVVHLHKPVHKFLTHVLLPVHGVADSMK